jgi:septal ring factor EnvC (AmiA/AmiB activator)
MQASQQPHCHPRHEIQIPHRNQCGLLLAAIRAEAEAVADERQRIDQNQGRMDRFERHVKTHNTRVKVAQANAESFRTDVEALNKALLAHNDQCGGISFRAEDKEAILKERESATK